ncbi:MAG: DUF2264 domain-containing protein [Cyanobacteria bacterium]|jgi:hypothetical protein|nr:DUF2264 domain-containing protein [Cyanobacteria bacterium GSL.Bin21]
MKQIFMKSKKLRPVLGWRNQINPFHGYEKLDFQIKSNFLKENSKASFSRYEGLFKYFIFGFTRYRSQKGAMVFYPGAKSIHGEKADAIEGFARLFPLIAAWLFSTEEREINIDEENIDLVELIREGIVSGTNPESSEYWGIIEDRDQLIVEAADIALGLWISRKHLWSILSSEEREDIVNWLLQTLERDVFSGVNSNWELFPIVVLKALAGLGIKEKKYKNLVKKRFNYFKRHYLGNGWFYDSPKGADYYNAWAFHYSLFWLFQMDRNLDSNFIIEAQSEFIRFYRYFFSDNGFPAMGRSLCYRIAAPAPIVCGALISPDLVSPGLAYRALDLTWRFFVKNNALKYGSITQGYLSTDLSLLDNYSGPGSSLWSLRSIIAAFYVDKFVPLWQSIPELLPVETSDFSHTCKSIGWNIRGFSATKTVELNIIRNKDNCYFPIKKYGSANRLLEITFRRPFRPNNVKALYYRPTYSTKQSLN